jgi:hypothetical protein
VWLSIWAKQNIYTYYILVKNVEGDHGPRQPPISSATEWECAQKILKHEGRVNRVQEEMKVQCPPRLKPAAPCKKMQPPGIIGSEPTEDYKKVKADKIAITTDGTSKNTKATDVLVQRKAVLLKLHYLQLLRNLLS